MAALCIAIAACACGRGATDAADAAVDAATGFQVQAPEFISVTADASTQPEDVTAIVDVMVDVALPIEASSASDANPIDAGVEVMADTDPPDISADILNDAADVVADAGPEVETKSTSGNDGFCFVGAPPAADVAIADAPQPEQCKLPLPLFIQETPDVPQTLQIELGDYDAMGKWQALQDGDWIALLHGGQGNLMVLVKFRVVLPGVDDPKVQMQTQTEGFIQCVNVALGNTATPYVVQTTETDVYTNAPLGEAGVLAVFSAKNGQSWQFCGQWLQLRLAVRDYKNPLKKNWAQVVRSLRLYDSAAVSSVKPP